MKERFMKYVDTSGSCWEWIGSKDAKGYGMFWCNGKSNRAHRMSLELYTGCNVENRIILHTCDNTSCVNPDHLQIGTQKDNVLDMHMKGRAASRKGSQNGASKLTEEDVQYILSSSEGNTALGRKFGVSKTTIHRVRSGQSWSHVKEVINESETN